jgi:hypothetical protein
MCFLHSFVLNVDVYDDIPTSSYLSLAKVVYGIKHLCHYIIITL